VGHFHESIITGHPVLWNDKTSFQEPAWLEIKINSIRTWFFYSHSIQKPNKKYQIIDFFIFSNFKNNYWVRIYSQILPDFEHLKILFRMYPRVYNYLLQIQYMNIDWFGCCTRGLPKCYLSILFWFSKKLSFFRFLQSFRLPLLWPLLLFF